METQNEMENESIRYNIRTLGIPQRHKCAYCGKTTYLKIEERKNLADCIMANGAGLWALLHCSHCGYVEQIYPTRINGVPCTIEECKQLFAEIERYDRESAK